MSNLSIRETLTESRALLSLAVPVTLGQVALMGMGITDVIFAGRAGTEQLAGITLGSNVWHLIGYFFFGVGMSAQILVGRHFGARDMGAIREQIQQSLWTALGCALVALLLILLALLILARLPFEQELRAVGIGYLAMMMLCAIPMCLVPVLRTSLEAMHQTRIVMLINISAFLINIPLDYALVFGVWGLPALGGIGCALATSILFWFMVAGYWMVMAWHPVNKPLGLLRNFSTPDWRRIRSTLALGLPIGFSILIELGFFAGAGILITLLGAIPASAHAVAINSAALAFMLYMGLGQGVTIRAANALGAGNPEAAAFSTRVGLVITLVLAGSISLVMILGRHWLPLLFTQDMEVVALASSLLFWAAIFQLADATQICAVSGMRAYKDTTSPPRYQILAFWVIAFPLGLILVYWQPWPFVAGPAGYWVAMTAGLGIVSVLLVRKLTAISRLELSHSGS